MKILCAYSGVEFTSTHFTGLSLDERQEAHPIFSMSSAALLALAPKYLEGSFSHVENYLYYLALFNSSGLIEFHTSAQQHGKTQAIIAQNCAQLIQFTERVHNMGAESARQNLELPKFAVTFDTRDMSNSHYWIQLWLSNYDDWRSNYVSRTLQQKLMQKETILERYIKDHRSDPVRYAGQVAEWAALAAGFADDKQYVADCTENDKPIQLCDYWKKLIKLCISEERIYALHEGDLSELIDHCEDHIEHGSIHAHLLMSKLRGALKLKRTAFDFGDFDIARKAINTPGAKRDGINPAATFTILEESDNIANNNLQMMIASAPASEPKLTDYPNRISWLKARAKWQLAQQYGQDGSTE